MYPRLRLRPFKYLFLFVVLVYTFIVIRQLCCGSNSDKALERWKRVYTEGKALKEDLVQINYTEGKAASTNESSLACPETSQLIGRLLHPIDINATSLNLNLSACCGGEIKFGGLWRPKYCNARKKVAFLIPFRNRSEQLSTFLNHMHPIFQRQLLDYRVFVIEQAGQDKFNKGAIYNIGFKETLKYDDYDCHVFHDVDLLCETDTNYYGCPNSPMHLSVGIDKFNYTLSYNELIGGIQLFSKEHYLKVNGYSNQFWGWGGEDDNLFRRIREKGLALVRPPANVARYKMNHYKHFRSDGWSQANHPLIRSLRTRSNNDGLTTTDKLNFSIETRDTLLYTLISINLHQERKK